MARLYIFLFVGITLVWPHAARAEDDMPSTLSPRATKEDPATPKPAPRELPVAPATPAPKRYVPTKFDLVMRKIDPKVALSLNRAKEGRTTGMLLTGIGSASLLVSTVLWSILEAAPPKRTDQNLDPTFGYKVGGIVTLVVGGLFAVPGAIVWGISDRKYRKLEAQIKVLVDEIDHPPVTPRPEQPPAPPKPEVETHAPEAIPSDRPLYQ